MKNDFIIIMTYLSIMTKLYHFYSFAEYVLKRMLCTLDDTCYEGITTILFACSF